MLHVTKTVSHSQSKNCIFSYHFCHPSTCALWPSLSIWYYV